jgi:hypothetical protein
MNNFSDFKIDTNVLVGSKINIEEVINSAIEVHSFKIVPSKHSKPGFEKCLHLQIKKDEKDFVLFTSSNVLINQISKVPLDGLPFKAKIVRAGKSLTFTN